MTSRLRWGVVAAVMAACVGYLVWSSTRASAEYYVTVAELRAHPPAGSVRVLGAIQDDVVRFDGGRHVTFSAAQDGAVVAVDYTGPLPDLFRPGIQVVAEGRLGADGVLHATTLQTKCPSRFTAATPSPAGAGG